MTAAELKARRDALGISYPVLARLIGVDPSALHRWEHSERAIPPLLDASLRDIERRHQHGQIPASGDVLWVMQRAGVSQDRAVRILGGTP